MSFYDPFIDETFISPRSLSYLQNDSKPDQINTNLNGFNYSNISGEYLQQNAGIDGSTENIGEQSDSGTNLVCMDINLFKKIHNDDHKFISEQSKQALTLIDIINAYSAENENLKSQLKNEMTEANEGFGNNNCDDFDCMHFIFSCALCLLIIFVVLYVLK